MDSAQAVETTFAYGYHLRQGGYGAQVCQHRAASLGIVGPPGVYAGRVECSLSPGEAFGLEHSLARQVYDGCAGWGVEVVCVEIEHILTYGTGS